MLTRAGPEIGVASTKGFLTQLVACYLLGLYLAQVRGTKFGDEIRAVVEELEQMPAAISAMMRSVAANVSTVSNSGSLSSWLSLL